MCLIKRELMVKNYEDCLPNNNIILKSQQRFKRIKSDYHELYTEEINKIALSSNNEKRLQTFNKTTTFPYGKNAIKVCESESMIVRDFFGKNYANCTFYDQIILQRQR